MKILTGALVFCGVCAMPLKASAAPDLKEILSAGSSAIGGLVEGVFTTSDLKVSDIAGQWTSEGSAVSFKSENFLKKAGGAAAAGAVESQLNPYYKKLGLTGAVLNIDNNGNFSLTIKKLSLNGTMTLKSKGIFTFKFTAFGGMSLGSMNAYIEKAGNSLNVMFDVDSIKKIISIVATLSGSKTVSAADKILQQYDGVCAGFKMKKTGNASTTKDTGKSTGKTTSKSEGDITESAVNALKGLFGN